MKKSFIDIFGGAFVPERDVSWMHVLMIKLPFEYHAE
jgi:hypothetical protein